MNKIRLLIYKIRYFLADDQGKFKLWIEILEHLPEGDRKELIEKAKEKLS